MCRQPYLNLSSIRFFIILMRLFVSDNLALDLVDRNDPLFDFQNLPDFR